MASFDALIELAEKWLEAGFLSGTEFVRAGRLAVIVGRSLGLRRNEVLEYALAVAAGEV